MADQSKRILWRGFLGAQMLSATVGFVGGQNSIFQALLGASTDGGATWDEDNFHHSILITMKAAALTCFSSIKTPALFQGAYSMDAAPSPERLTRGANWSTLFFDQAIQGINFPQPTSGFAVGAGGRISHSTDAGITWTDQASGTSANLNDVFFASDALRGIAVGDSGTIVWTANGGEPGPTPTPTPTPVLLQQLPLSRHRGLRRRLGLVPHRRQRPTNSSRK